MTKLQTYPLYELSGEDFERLAIELILAAESTLTLANHASLQWVDAVGTRATAQGNISVAIEVKHRSTFNPDNLRIFLTRLAQKDLRFDEFIFITSSPIDDKHRRLSDLNAAKTLSANVRILGQHDVIELLNRYPAIAAKYFKSIRRRVQRRKISAVVSSATLVLSISLLGNSLYSFLEPKKQSEIPVSTQIKSIEVSLSKLTDLENGLVNLKKDLQQTSEESARVKAEYEEAMKLKVLTAEQLEQVKKAVVGQSRWEIFQNYFFGFLLGVAGSVLATIITDKWKQRKELSRSIAEIERQ